MHSFPNCKKVCLKSQIPLTCYHQFPRKLAKNEQNYVVLSTNSTCDMHSIVKKSYECFISIKGSI